MAYSYIWPTSLPQCPTPDGYSEDGGLRVVRSPMVAGVPKQRLIGARPSKMTVTMVMTNAQFNTFEAFIRDDIKGIARFGFPHPRRMTEVEVRILPQDDGLMYSLSRFAFQTWSVTFNLEILP